MIIGGRVLPYNMTIHPPQLPVLHHLGDAVTFILLMSHSQKRGVDFEWGADKIRGVNIGGWLVLEP